MRKKALAKEILFLFGSIILILLTCTIWYFIQKPTEVNQENLIVKSHESVEKTENVVRNENEKIGYKLRLFDKIKNSGKQRSLQVMEVHDEKIFLKQITNTDLNRRLYDKSLEFETYDWNGTTFPREVLIEKFGEKFNAAIIKFDFRRNPFLTDLSYEEFNEKIQKDTISKTRNLNKTKLKSKNLASKPSESSNSKGESAISKFNYKKDFKIISFAILILAFPFRWSIYALLWSVKQVKN